MGSLMWHFAKKELLLSFLAPALVQNWNFCKGESKNHHETKKSGYNCVKTFGMAWMSKKAIRNFAGKKSSPPPWKKSRAHLCLFLCLFFLLSSLINRKSLLMRLKSHISVELISWKFQRCIDIKCRKNNS